MSTLSCPSSAILENCLEWVLETFKQLTFMYKSLQEMLIYIVICASLRPFLIEISRHPRRFRLHVYLFVASRTETILL